MNCSSTAFSATQSFGSTGFTSATTRAATVEYSAKKEEVHKIAFDLPGGHGKGTCIWEPLSTWESVFDWQGNAKDLLNLYDGFRKRYLEE